MKAQKNTPAVLLYRLPEFTIQGKAVRNFLSDHQIRAITVNPGDSGRTIANLLGMGQDAAGQNVPLPSEPVAVLYGLMGPVFDEFLEFLEKTAPIRLKAVATPYNLHWTFGRLAGQLSRESLQTEKNETKQ